MLSYRILIPVVLLISKSIKILTKAKSLGGRDVPPKIYSSILQV